MACDPDSWAHDFRFWLDGDDVILCDCGQAAALFDPDTGDMTGIRGVT